MLGDKEGSIRKRKDFRWEGRYTAGYDQDGKRLIKNALGKTQADVKAKLAAAIVESQQLDVSRSGEYTVAEWLRLWFELYAKPNIRPSTTGYYRRAMEEYTIPRIGSNKLNKLTSRKIQKLYKDLLENGRLRKKQMKKRPGLSGSTVRGVHIMLHRALDQAVKVRLLIRNSADSCVVPKVQHREMKTLQPEDLKAYLDAAEGEVPWLCSIWNWLVASAKANWWPCNGRTWMWSSGPSPSANAQPRMKRAVSWSPALRRRTPCG